MFFISRTTMALGFCSLFISATAFGYAEKTYECENGPGLPKNTYKVRNVSVLGGSVVPYLEVARYYRENASDPNSAIRTQHLRGFATIHSTTPGTETLILAQLRLEFTGDELYNCK
ncbi:MAG: hypothetical protein KF799_00410 [Bdellovibrionales bacterium]|nr:hypothetical protein [Bdellovibrionales bacterium]